METEPITKTLMLGIMKSYYSVALALALFAAAVAAQNADVKIPDEVKPFVEAGTIADALEAGDLNGDGRRDFILVLSKIVKEDDRYEEGAGARSVILLIRDAGGKLQAVGRNEEVAMCKNCGGVFGDPFEGVSVQRTKFTVMNYGGSSDRWAYSYSFAYSRRDQNWQLVKVEESHFKTFDPERSRKTKIYAPPKDFGLITFADFDPANFKQKGKK